MELLMPFHASLLACWHLWLCNIHHSVQIQISILCAMHCQHWNIHVPPPAPQASSAYGEGGWLLGYAFGDH